VAHPSAKVALEKLELLLQVQLELIYTLFAINFRVHRKEVLKGSKFIVELSSEGLIASHVAHSNVVLVDVVPIVNRFIMLLPRTVV
jgi:hypothetical protein